MNATTAPLGLRLEPQVLLGSRSRTCNHTAAITGRYGASPIATRDLPPASPVLCRACKLWKGQGRKLDGLASASSRTSEHLRCRCKVRNWRQMRVLRSAAPTGNSCKHRLRRKIRSQARTGRTDAALAQHLSDMLGGRHNWRHSRASLPQLLVGHLSKGKQKRRGLYSIGREAHLLSEPWDGHSGAWQRRSKANLPLPDLPRGRSNFK